MFNSATLAVMLLFILSAILFTSTTVSIAIYYARKKADTEEKALITKNDYQKTILIFSIINFIASFVAMAVPNITSSGDNNHISIAQFTYLSLILAILAAGVVEFFIAKSTIFQRFSCSKTDKTKRAAVFAAICAPYYIFIVSSPIVLFIIAVSLYPC
ncbi:Uncharacterised protein [uncultured Ruminococcus sp.]|jgi:protein-S-isoprenylcysteine O-methyltransferase Ste14|nr:hypothetical protein [uncultured Ruminococcus sp.]SCJ15315.1 Uncharacterised protein [uncultured Ruminococcus sp.]